jgi:retron-type reverse transcriptase
VVQGALKLIVEPIFEADFQPGSFGYRPKRSAHQALVRVADAIAHGKTRVIDIDLRSYFDGVRHDLLLAKIARRIGDDDVLCLLKIMLKANGKQGVPQGGVISPLLSNLYLNEVDRRYSSSAPVGPERPISPRNVPITAAIATCLIMIDSFSWPRQMHLQLVTTNASLGQTAGLFV